jgi:16S rRNA G527 N7-methylase RsmG
MDVEKGLEIRWEYLRQDSNSCFQELWQEVFSRATFPMQTWVKLGSMLLQPGGRLWLMGTQKFIEQVKSKEWKQFLPPGFTIDLVRLYCLPYSDIKRTFITLKRIK